MPRLLFEKTGNAVWISHLDLMRVFQRAFKRANLNLKHTQGFNPRPSVSIALPMSVGLESSCELLDFDLDGQTIGNDEILQRLNDALTEGVRVLKVYDNGAKLKNLAYMDCTAVLEYDSSVPETAVDEIRQLFGREEVTVEKKGKNGVTLQNIIPMIKTISVEQSDENMLLLRARICCQNPALNPMALCAAVSAYLPHVAPDYSSCRREELYDVNENLFR